MTCIPRAAQSLLQSEEGRASSWRSCRAHTGEEREEKAAEAVTTCPGVWSQSSSTAMVKPLLQLQGEILGIAPAPCCPMDQLMPAIQAARNEEKGK